MAADTFFPRTNGLFFDVVNARTGEIVEELVDCIGAARDWCAEHAARALEAEHAEAAALAEQQADYMAESDMLDAIYREVSRRYDCAIPETDPRNRAVKLALEALDGISKPVADDVREAA